MHSAPCLPRGGEAEAKVAVQGWATCGGAGRGGGQRGGQKRGAMEKRDGEARWRSEMEIEMGTRGGESVRPEGRQWESGGRLRGPCIKHASNLCPSVHCGSIGAAHPALATPQDASTGRPPRTHLRCASKGWAQSTQPTRLAARIRSERWPEDAREGEVRRGKAR